MMSGRIAQKQYACFSFDHVLDEAGKWGMNIYEESARTHIFSYSIL